VSAETRPPVDPLPSPSLESGAEIDIAAIKHQSIRGGAITFVTQGANVVIQLTSTLVLARLLKPTDYGIIAMVTAVTGFAGLFRDLGLSASIIQRDKLTEEQLSTIYWINVGLGALLTVVVASMSPLVGWFYGRPELNLVTAVVSLSFIIGSFGAQPGALLTRKMLFGRLAVAQLSGALVGLTVSIGMALNGFSYWSLAVGALTGGIVTSVLLNSLCGRRPGLAVRGAGVRSMLRYGANITAFEVVNYFHRNLDNILIGRFWGADALGVYSRAYALLMFPINTLRGPINAVAFPAMSRLQDQPEQFRAYYREITAMLAFCSMPLTGFFFIAAAPVVRVTLGDGWQEVVQIFSVLAVVAFIQPPLSLIGMVNLSLGNTKRHLNQGVVYAVCVSGAFATGVRWGPLGVAVGYAIVTYLFCYPLLRWTFRRTPLQPMDFMRAIVRPMTSSLSAVALCLLIQPFLGSMHSPGEIASHLLVFAAAFSGVYISLPGGLADLRHKAGFVRHLRSTRSYTADA
jgi:PST family polysaccharide transporter